MSEIAMEKPVGLTQEQEVAFNELTETEKAAIVMFLLEEDGASAVMKTLSPGQVTAVSRAMIRVSNVDQPIVVAVVDEFLASLQGLTDLGMGGPDYVRRVLLSSVGESKAATVLAKVDPTARSSGLEMLDWMAPRAIADMVGAEHPQVIAIILAMLDERTASDVLSYLSVDLKASVISRLATLDTISDSALGQLEKVMQSKFSESTSISSAQLGGLRVAAKIMDKSKSEDASDIFDEMRATDENLVMAIEDNMFDFENLVDLADRDIQTMINNFDEEELRTALKGAEEGLLDKFKVNMSKNKAEMFQDEMDLMPPLAISVVDAARKSIIRQARKLQDKGELILASPEGGDFV
jgi:flagellar motor switch protein FliG